MNKKEKELYEKLDERELANIIAEYTDIEEIRRKTAGKKPKKSELTLHGFKAFNKLIHLFPADTAIYTFDTGVWWGGSRVCVFHRYLLLLDEQTPILFNFEEKYKGKEVYELCSTSLSINAYAGGGKINISVTDGIWPDTSLISIIDSSDNKEIFKISARGDYSSYNGKNATDIIQPIDLANFVKREDLDYQFQKVKKSK